MKVTLMDWGNLYNIIYAIRICHDSITKSDSAMEIGGFTLGYKDKKLLQSVIKEGHTSTLEHMNYTYYIEGISRGCLQELVRHRIASYSVQSTRYTLKKRLATEDTAFVDEYNMYPKVLENYCVLTGKEEVDFAVAFQMEQVKKALSQSMGNDIVKYMLPEAFKTKLVMTINARSLRNLLKLRLAKDAHPEIRELAGDLYDNIPELHKVMFEDLVGGIYEQTV